MTNTNATTTTNTTMTATTTNTTMTDDQTTLDTPIKVRWEGDARTKFMTREIEPREGTPDAKAEAQVARRTMTREKTNVVVETVEEAEALINLLESFRGHAGPHGAMWATASHRRAIDRVLDTVREEFDAATADEGDDDDVDRGSGVETDGGFIMDPDEVDWNDELLHDAEYLHRTWGEEVAHIGGLYDAATSFVALMDQREDSLESISSDPTRRLRTAETHALKSLSQLRKEAREAAYAYVTDADDDDVDRGDGVETDGGQDVDPAEPEYVARVGECHPALIVIGDGYDRESAPSLEAVREAIDSTEWGLSSVYDMREGRVEIQHETPPTDPYPTWGVVVAFEQSPTNLNYSTQGPIDSAAEAIHYALDDVEIWVDAV